MVTAAVAVFKFAGFTARARASIWWPRHIQKIGIGFAYTETSSA